MTSTELTLREQREYAELLSQSDLLPRSYQRQPANVLVAMAFGEALDLKPVVAMNQINVINGKPSFSADLVASLIRRAGHTLRIIERKDPLSVTAVLIRKDDPDFEFKATWDEGKASRAGLMSNLNWRKYPEQMMRARAVTEVARMGASEALNGFIYAADEVSETRVERPKHRVLSSPGVRPDLVGESSPVVVDAVASTPEPELIVVDVSDSEVVETPPVEHPDDTDDSVQDAVTEGVDSDDESSPEQVEQVERILDLYTKLDLNEEQLHATFRYVYKKRLPGKLDDWNHWPWRSLKNIADYMQTRFEEKSLA